MKQCNPSLLTLTRLLNGSKMHADRIRVLVSPNAGQGAEPVLRKLKRRLDERRRRWTLLLLRF